MSLGAALTAATFAALALGVALGAWHGGRVALRILGARLTHLEREVEMLAVEVARIDTTAILWTPPAEAMAETEVDTCSSPCC